MDKHIRPTDPELERSRGRVALWLDPQDLEWLSSHCGCGPGASFEEHERCLRIRFRAGAALHKAGFSREAEISPEEFEKQLEDDCRLARERNLSFKVVRKAARAAKWEAVNTTTDLREALAQAKAIDDWESGIFADGFKYWSSHTPDLLNSTVISWEYTVDPE